MINPRDPRTGRLLNKPRDASPRAPAWRVMIDN